MVARAIYNQGGWSLTCNTLKPKNMQQKGFYTSIIEESRAILSISVKILAINNNPSNVSRYFFGKTMQMPAG
jgi:uncharacterized integral membrane protein